MYAIADFVNTNLAAVIPTNWFYDKKEKILVATKILEHFQEKQSCCNKAVVERWTPHLNWKTFEICVIGKEGTFVYI